MAEAESEIPRKVALFSGHMIDRSGRKTPRFPPGREPIAAAAIAKALADLDIGANDLAICGGACGGDLLFADAALARAARLEIYIPFEEPQFLANSVGFADGFADPPWTARFEGAKARGSLHIAARELGPTVAGEDPYGRNNLWMLEAASRFGAEKLDFICLWDGQGGDDAGGTSDMWDKVKERGGRTIWLEVQKLWPSS
jgi:hypothetical protein